MNAATKITSDHIFDGQFESFTKELNELQQLTLFLCGNPDRADDAAGFDLYNRLKNNNNIMNNKDILLIYDLQWQLEDALNLSRDRVALFIDSAVGQNSLIQLAAISKPEEFTPFSHSLNPAQLLNVSDQIGQQRPDHVWQLTISGHEYELGERMTTQCRQVTEQVGDLLLNLLLTWQKN
ncbi:MAG: hypothetical protein V7739_17335 [Motiliproteus sp.]